MAGVKLAPRRKSRATHKCTAIDLEIKIRMIHKYVGEQSLSAIAFELDFLVLTMNTFVKDAARIKECVTRITKMKSVILTKKCEVAIIGMEKLLTMWMEAQIQKLVLQIWHM
jgi:hypothetical protein